MGRNRIPSIGSQVALAANLLPPTLFPDHAAMAPTRFVTAMRVRVANHGGTVGKATAHGGKGGSLHSADPRVGKLCDNPLRAVYGHSSGRGARGQDAQQDKVSCAIIGDGTVGRGSSTRASTWRLPGTCRCCMHASTTASRDESRSPSATPPATLSISRGYASMQTSTATRSSPPTMR